MSGKLENVSRIDPAAPVQVAVHRRRSSTFPPIVHQKQEIGFVNDPALVKIRLLSPRRIQASGTRNIRGGSAPHKGKTEK
jgi:hypothetical protein